MKGLYLVLFMCSFTVPVLCSIQEDLITAIEKGNLSKVVEALSQNIDYNWHSHYDPNDFSSSDWSPLMKAIARLGTLLIEAQSFINTVSASYKEIILPVNLVSAVASFFYVKNLLPIPKPESSSLWSQFVSRIKGFVQSKYFIIPALTTGVLTGAGQYLLVSKTKKSFQAKIENQYEIIQLLLKQDDIDKSYRSHNGETAYSLCQKIYQLLHSPHLSPPYKPRAPEKTYIAMIEKTMKTIGSIEQKMPAEQEFVKSEYFQKDNVFESIESEEYPIVFDPEYDITFFGIENLHPFDTKKYSKIASYLKQQFPNLSFFAPEEATDADYGLVHSEGYLNFLKSSWNVGLIADMPFLGIFPSSIAERILLRPVKRAVGGTIRAAKLAKEYGWAINLSGGYHHAKSDDPVYGGFCLINDAGIAAKKMLEQHPEYRILIVDLDAHQGNGNTNIAKHEKNIAIFDMFNADTWPGDFAELERINFPVFLKAKTDTDEYLKLLQENLPHVIDRVRPDFIIYNAGTDVYEKDPIGELSVSGEGIINRDAFVFTEALKRKIPIMMMLSGGYHKDSAAIIGNSIHNLIQNVVMKKE